MKLLQVLVVLEFKHAAQARGARKTRILARFAMHLDPRLPMCRDKRLNSGLLVAL